MVKRIRVRKTRDRNTEHDLGYAHGYKQGIIDACHVAEENYKELQEKLDTVTEYANRVTKDKKIMSAKLRQHARALQRKRGH